MHLLDLVDFVLGQAGVNLFHKVLIGVFLLSFLKLHFHNILFHFIILNLLSELVVLNLDAGGDEDQFVVQFSDALDSGHSLEVAHVSSCVLVFGCELSSLAWFKHA